MHSISPRPARDTIVRLASAASLTLVLMLAAALVRAQCTITGPTAVCGGAAATLCAPPGYDAYEWTGPNNFQATDQCITVSVAGTYSVMYFEAFSGQWIGPCDHPLTVGTATAASITGPTSACSGTPIGLCGPTGNFSYAWSGPNSFAATSACIQVSAAGTYSLVVTDLASGCSGAAASQTVAFTTCSSGPNCPRPARFWASQCGQAADALSAAQMASVAACVDQHCDLFSWSSPTDGLCSVLQIAAAPTLRARAKRQFAAVVANVCAGNLAVTTSQGSSIGLDAATAVGSTTVGSWMAATDQRMMTLESGSLHDKSVKAAYRDIIRTAWNINHGHGIGPVCGRPEHDTHHGVNGSLMPVGAGTGVNGDELGGDVNSGDAAEPLEAELTADGDAELAIRQIAPNPATDRASITYELMASSSQLVSIGVYDLAGRRLRQLVNAPQAPGLYVIDWDGRDASGQSVPGGVYFVRGHAGSQPVQSRVTLVR